MNADLHMAEALKKTDIDIEPADGDARVEDWIRVKIKCRRLFDPSAGEVRSDVPDGIAC